MRTTELSCFFTGNGSVLPGHGPKTLRPRKPTGTLLEETNASGAAQADYIYLDSRPVAVLNGSTVYMLRDDMLGTPQLATDASRAVAWQATYQPFGTASVSGTITQNLRFPGQYFDVESGWNHNGFRDYAPQLGRYIEPDPLGRLGSGNNLYAYVYDNPTNLFDPLGLCPKCQAQPSGQTPPQYSNMWERAFDILSNGGFIYYGNWGGPGWTGGQLTPYEDLSPEDQQNLAPPIDAQDNCYMQHDMCYSRSRVEDNGTTAAQKCQSPQQKQSEKDYQRSCDAQLMMCLRGINSSSHPGWGNQPSGYNIHSLIGEPTFSIKEMWP